MLIILSPHRDDAAFSCGILLTVCAEAEIETQIINDFTLSDYAPFSGTVGREAVTALREREDAELQARIGPSLSFIDLRILDAPLRFGVPAEQTLLEPLNGEEYGREVTALAALLGPYLTAASCVLAPLAMGGHIDHRIVRDAARASCVMTKLAFYEDLPYAARLDGVQRAWYVDTLRRDLASEIMPIAVKHVDGVGRKRDLARLYPSQIEHDTAEEIANYAGTLGGSEILYGSRNVREFLNGIGSGVASGAKEVA